MRWKPFVLIAGIIICSGVGGTTSQAKTHAIDELPHDLWNLATLWTEPIKGVARNTRRFDPVSGLWFGLLEGSEKSVERTGQFLFPPTEDTPRPTIKSGKALLHYSF